MAEGRMLKKRISESKKLSALRSDSARLLYTWLIPWLDVEGRYMADSEIIKGSIFPKIKSWTAKKIDTCLNELDDLGLIFLYEFNNEPYLQFTKFHEIQKIHRNREAASRIPAPPANIKKKRNPILKEDYDCLWKKWKSSGRICPACRKKGKFVPEIGWVIEGYIPFEVDHIVPLSKGGETKRENLRVICRKCNREKGDNFGYSCNRMITHAKVKVKESKLKEVKLKKDEILKLYAKYKIDKFKTIEEFFQSTFDDLWNMWPKDGRLNKAAGKEKYFTRCWEGLLPDIIRGANGYVEFLNYQETEKNFQQRAMYLSTFLEPKKARWKEFMAFKKPIKL